MEGDVSSQPKLAKFDIPAENVTEKIFAFERQLADLEEHCKLLKTSMSRDHWRKKPEKVRADEDGQGEMQMSTYTADSRRIQDYYCITQGVSERDGVIDARRLADEDSPPRVDVNSPSPLPSSSEDATSLFNERSEKLTLFINPLSDIGERGTSQANLVKSCEWEAGRNRNLSESLQRSQCRLSASAMAAEEQDSAIGTPHPYLQRTTSFTFPELHSPSEESCALFQTSRDKPLAPLAPPMGRVHVRVSNSDSQGEDFWEFDTCTSDLESVSLGTSPSSVDSHSPRFGNTSSAPYAKSPFTGMSSSLGRSKSDRYLNVENWSLDQTSGTSSTSMNETLDLKELRPGRKPRRTVAATLRPPEMTVFLKEQQANVSNDYTQDNSAKVSGQNKNMKSEPCPEYDTEHTEEELRFYVPVVSSDSDNVEHESIILSISTSERSDVIDTSLKPVKKSWHQCIKDTVVNTIRSIFCTVEEDHDLEDLDMQTVRYKPEGLDTLCRATKFNRKELQLMYRGFKQECPSGVVNEETFKNIYSQFFPQGDSSRYAHFVFNSFDTDHNGSLTFEEFVSGLSILARGTVNEKLNWAFNLYDINGDGYITREEMLSVVQAIYDMMGKYSEPTAEDITPSEHVERVFQKMDVNGDGVVSIEEFIDCCKKDETITRSMHVFDTIL